MAANIGSSVPTATPRKQKDGSLLAEFQLSSIEEIKRWVLSFGRNAVVLEPEELRRDLASEISAMRSAYLPRRKVKQ
ncbi:MAG: WYL domain-containing protein [Pirellulales bacterium]|nr:WYL domain-containing protein [Pirellulales bacterium]